MSATKAHRGEIDKLKPEYRLALARHGYALVKCELVSSLREWSGMGPTSFIRPIRGLWSPQPPNLRLRRAVTALKSTSRLPEVTIPPRKSPPPLSLSVAPR